jgi:single-stranded DNA-binding protein
MAQRVMQEAIFNSVKEVLAKANEEKAGDKLVKGDKVFVSGRIQVRSYEGPDHKKRYVTEVICNFISDKAITDADRSSSFDKMGNDVSGEEIPF